MRIIDAERIQTRRASVCACMQGLEAGERAQAVANLGRGG